MNTENMKAWVAALRSGEYKQGRSCLRSADGTFCCLGVAGDLYAKVHNVEWIQQAGGPKESFEKIADLLEARYLSGGAEP